MKIKVLLVMPNKEIQIARIPGSIKFIKAFIGNDLKKIKLDDHTIIIANKNARLYEFNRIYKGNVILGTFLIVSIKNNQRVSMKKKDLRKYSNIFKLKKHQRKVNTYRDTYMDSYYSKQIKNNNMDAEINIDKTFNIAA